MTHASVFSGIGGPEVAAEMLGWDNLFHCEINPFGRAVLDYWFPTAKSYEDITKTDFSEWRGRVNVLTGGFPCQPFSYAGQRRGAEDDRYLWPFMFKAIDAIRPDWVVAENVAGITTMVEQGEVSPMGTEQDIFSEDGDIHRYRLTSTFTLQRICTDLANHGYTVQPVLIPACAVGAPHRRDRVFIVAHRNADDSDRGTDRREPGVVQSKGEEERLQKRHDIQQSVKSGEVRPEGEGNAAAYASGSGEGASRKSGSTQSSRRDSDKQQSLRRAASERDNRLHAVLRNFADTDYIIRREQSVEQRIPGDQEQREPGRSDSEYDVKNSMCCGQPHGCDEEQGSERNVRHAGTRAAEWLCRETWFCHPGGYEVGQRWGSFPTVSPVHRGNDGLPFPMDDLTISPSKWRTEALKAYGNAIVPQVMYEIFRAIEIIENESQK